MSLYLKSVKNPLIATLSNHIDGYPSPINLSYLWGFGSLAGIALVVQIVTGVLLAMHYAAEIHLAFNSVEHIMRDVKGGVILRYIHANGASMFFIVVYTHIFRGLYYGSYFQPRANLWYSGILIFFLMMATAFMGYVLPWGQMSFWGATVITNLFSAIPGIGNSIVQLLWGGFSVDNPTLNRFFSLHYFVPFIIAGAAMLHLILLHQNGSNNPLGMNSAIDRIPFYPYFYVKDLFGFFIFVLIFSFFVIYAPNFLGHPDNYIEANPLVTPAHIVPEWYFLPFYAVLRTIPDKLGGVLLMGIAIVILALLPVVDTSALRSNFFKPLSIWFFWYFFADSVSLGWIGQEIVESPFIEMANFVTFSYFAYFILFLPLAGFLENAVIDHFLRYVEDSRIYTVYEHGYVFGLEYETVVYDELYEEDEEDIHTNLWEAELADSVQQIKNKQLQIEIENLRQCGMFPTSFIFIAGAALTTKYLHLRRQNWIDNPLIKEQQKEVQSEAIIPYQGVVEKVQSNAQSLEPKKYYRLDADLKDHMYEVSSRSSASPVATPTDVHGNIPYCNDFVKKSGGASAPSSDKSFSESFISDFFFDNIFGYFFLNLLILVAICLIFVFCVEPADPVKQTKNKQLQIEIENLRQCGMVPTSFIFIVGAALTTKYLHLRRQNWIDNPLIKEQQKEAQSEAIIPYQGVVEKVQSNAQSLEPKKYYRLDADLKDHMYEVNSRSSASPVATPTDVHGNIPYCNDFVKKSGGASAPSSDKSFSESFISDFFFDNTFGYVSLYLLILAVICLIFVSIFLRPEVKWYHKYVSLLFAYILANISLDKVYRNFYNTSEGVRVNVVEFLQDYSSFANLFFFYSLSITILFIYGLVDRHYVQNNAELEFSFLVFFILVGAVSIFYVHTLVDLVLALEVVTLSSYVLVAFERRNRFSTFAGVQYFILGSIPSGMLILGASLLYKHWGSLALEDLDILSTSFFVDSKESIHNVILMASQDFDLNGDAFLAMLDYIARDNFWLELTNTFALSFHNWNVNENIENSKLMWETVIKESSPLTFTTILAIILIFFNFLFKLTAAPFHFWAPAIYGKAPTPTTTFLSIFSKVMIFFIMYKFMMTFCHGYRLILTSFLIFCGIVSVLFGMVGAFTEKYTKRFFVYSSMGHVGFMLIGLSLFSIEGIGATFHYLPVYVISSFIMWFVLLSMGPKARKLVSFKKLKNRNSVIAMIFSLVIFSMSGIPPLGGFFVKFDVLVALAASSRFYLIYTLFIFTVASFFYYLRVIKIIYFDSEGQEQLKKKKMIIENNGERNNVIFTLCFILFFYIIIVQKPLLLIQMDSLSALFDIL